MALAGCVEVYDALINETGAPIELYADLPAASERGVRLEPDKARVSYRERPDLKSFATRAGACRYVYHVDRETLEARLRRMRAATVGVESTGERLLTFIIKVRVRPDFSVVVGPKRYYESTSSRVLTEDDLSVVYQPVRVDCRR